jgi:hypothetical protein
MYSQLHLPSEAPLAYVTTVITALILLLLEYLPADVISYGSISGVMLI